MVNDLTSLKKRPLNGNTGVNSIQGFSVIFYRLYKVHASAEGRRNVLKRAKFKM